MLHITHDTPKCSSQTFCLSAATNMWRRVHPMAGSKKDGPPALCGHAMAASEGKIWVAGGRVGRKLQRRTFCLDTGAAAELYKSPMS